MILATCGVIGLWGLNFFSPDLTQTAFRNTENQVARERGDIETMDFELVRMLVSNPNEFLPIARDKRLTQHSFIGSAPKTNDAGMIYQAVTEVMERIAVINVGDNGKEWFLEHLDQPSQDGKRKAQTSAEKERRKTILDQAPKQPDKVEFERLATGIADRTKKISGYVGMWGGITSVLFNFGAIFGTLGITFVAERWGRRIAFTMFFAASFFLTIFVFQTMGTGITGNPQRDVIIMQPILGFCVLAIFGGYAIYFPELFPTRLRSTGVSFCYNIGRFAAAAGPATLGLLSAYVFVNTDEPMRWAGAVMSVTFILGIIFAWLGPETKGQPLPEE
jgi:hypothetical protein